MAIPSNPEDRVGWELLFRHGAFPPRYQTLAAPNESVVAWADTLSPGSSVLDVGCGVGRHVIYLGGRGFKMSGTDISPSGIRQTQEACAERQLEFDGRVADMTALPWADMSFDAVLSTSTISHNRVADILKTLHEIRRVLKPGGLLLVDFLHRDTLSYQSAREQVANGKLSEIEPNTFADQSAEPDPMEDDFLPHHYCDEAEVRDLLHSFEIIQLWADLPGRTADGGWGRRGYWIASAQKSAT